MTFRQIGIDDPYTMGVVPKLTKRTCTLTFNAKICVCDCPAIYLELLDERGEKLAFIHFEDPELVEFLKDAEADEAREALRAARG